MKRTQKERFFSARPFVWGRRRDLVCQGYAAGQSTEARYAPDSLCGGRLGDDGCPCIVLWHSGTAAGNKKYSTQIYQTERGA